MTNQRYYIIIGALFLILSQTNKYEFFQIAFSILSIFFGTIGIFSKSNKS